MQRVLTLLKQYSTLLIVLAALGYAGYAVWNIYTNVYSPVVLEASPPAISNRFRVPKVDDSITSPGTVEEKINVYTFPNRFIDISQVESLSGPNIDPTVTGDTET